MPTKPTIYLIGGCNGAGKTTFAREFLLKEAACSNFLNADYLALGLSPLSPELAAMKAGRLLLVEFKSFVARNIQPTETAGAFRHLHADGITTYALAMKKARKTDRKDDFIAPARRALVRAARKVREENRRFGLPLITWKNSKTVEKPA